MHASETEKADLFWGIRGGGGNFGVVTSFEFRLHAVGPEVLAGLIVHPFSAAGEVLRAYRRLVVEGAGRALLLGRAAQGAAPAFPADGGARDGGRRPGAVLFRGRRPERSGRALPRDREADRRRGRVRIPFVGWQTAFDPLLTPGARNYWKSHDFVELRDGLLDALLDAVRRLPSPECEIFIGHLGGAINRVPAEATAYPHRDIQFVMNVHTRWGEPSEDAACIAWARAFYDAAAPFATGGVYVNFMPDDEAERVRTGAYGPNYDRLAKLKAKYDPGNLFRLNQNVAPSS